MQELNTETFLEISGDSVGEKKKKCSDIKRIIHY
jgi:hypothetical protein